MRRYLLIQPLALGDLLMTTPLLAGIKADHADCRLWVLANQAFGEVLEDNPALDGFLPLPYQQLYRLANQERPGALAEALALLARLSEGLAGKWDMVHTPAFNDLAGALTRLAGGERVLGCDLTREGYLVTRGDWCACLNLGFGEPAFLPFHTADLHCLAAGVEPPEPGLRVVLTPNHRRRATELLRELGAREGRPLAALHPAATRDHKRWPLESFAILGDKLREAGFSPLILGGPGQKDLCRRLARSLGDGAIDAGGHTTIRQAAALLERCDLLVSSDSGPIHLAAAVGTPVVSISLGRVQPRVTGPYLPGSLALEAELDCAPCADPAACPHQRCKQTITPDDALAAVWVLLGRPFQPPAGSRCRFFQATRGQDGLLDWRRLDQLPGGQQALYQAYRRAWREVLHPGPEPPRPPVSAPPAVNHPWSRLEALTGRAIQALQRLQAALAGQDYQAAQQAAGEVARAEDGIRGLGESQPAVQPAVLYFLHRRGGLDAETAPEQATQQAGLYRQMRELARRLDQQTNPNPKAGEDA